MAGISPAVAGIIATIGMIWDGVNDPLIGYFADHRRFKSGEKARPYALWFGFPTAICFLLLFTVFDLSPTMTIVYAMSVYFIYHLFITFFQIPIFSMPTLASSKPQERVAINTFISGGANLGTVISTLLIWPLIELFGGVNAQGELVNERRGFFFAAAIMAVLIMAGSLLHYFTTRERVTPPNSDTSRIPIKTIFKMLLTSKSWRFNTLFLAFSNFHNVFISITVVYLATSVLGDSGAVTLLMASYLGGAVLALPFIGLIHKKLGRRKTMIATTLTLIISKFYFILTPATLLSALSVAIFVGIGVSINLVMTGTTNSEVVDMVAHRYGRRIENLLSTITTLIIKLALAVVTFVVGMTFEFVGYNADLGIVPMCAAVVMFLLALRFPVEKEMALMKAEKEAQAQ